VTPGKKKAPRQKPWGAEATRIKNLFSWLGRSGELLLSPDKEARRRHGAAIPRSGDAV